MTVLLVAALLFAGTSAIVSEAAGADLVGSITPSRFAVSDTDRGASGSTADEGVSSEGVGGGRNPIAKLWNGFLDTPLGSRLEGITRWVGSVFRFLWAIPKALFQGDSRSMIEALGDLLSPAAAPKAGETAKPVGTKDLPAADPLPIRAPSEADRS
jgi:hypothetical protein